jgi:hypothetical protein
VWVLLTVGWVVCELCVDWRLDWGKCDRERVKSSESKLYVSWFGSRIGVVSSGWSVGRAKGGPSE